MTLMASSTEYDPIVLKLAEALPKPGDDQQSFDFIRAVAPWPHSDLTILASYITDDRKRADFWQQIKAARTA